MLGAQWERRTALFTSDQWLILLAIPAVMGAVYWLMIAAQDAVYSALEKRRARQYREMQQVLDSIDDDDGGERPSPSA